MKALIIGIFAAICVCLVASVPTKGVSFPQAGVGCNDTTDLGVFKAKNSTFHAELQACATKCLGAEACSTTCVENDIGLTADCAGCFGADVACTAKYCFKYCDTDPNGANCLDCTKQNCFPALLTCAQVNATQIPP